MTQPVTVAITRQVDPAKTAEMAAWIQAGTRLAAGFPGFLGSGWVRSGQDSDEWHMLYRFADAASLADWDASSQRAWWLNAGQSFVGETRVERRTGIEGWFDPPRTYDVEEVSGIASAPPRWKQAVAIFVLFYPLSVLANWLTGSYLDDVSIPLRVLVATAVMIPFMTYVGLPWITRTLEWWLQGKPAPWREGVRG